jgi:magnesium chelatase subunit I
MSISNTECLLSNAEKRAIRLGEKEAAPRVSDLPSIVSLTAGKLELETFSHDGQQDKFIRHLVDEAVKQIFDKHFDVASLSGIVNAFQEGATVTVSDSIDSEECLREFSQINDLTSIAESFCPKSTPAVLASAAEFILEGLYLHRFIHKESVGSGLRYKG